MLAYLIHNVVDRDTSYQTSDTIDYGQGYQVVFLDRLRNLLDTVAVANGDRVFFHDMLDLGDGWVGNQFLQGEHAFQALVVVHYIYIIDLAHLLRLLAHLVDTFGHTPILVHHDHLGTHQTAGGVLVVFQQVHDITGLLYVLDMRKDLLLGILVQLTHQVNGIIRFHVIDETLGDKLIGKFLQ